jgi:hypothetical protein
MWTCWGLRMGRRPVGPVRRALLPKLWKPTPAAISTMRMAATIQSTAAQKGGHQRVPRTNWVRSCQRSLAPWAAYASTSSHAVAETATGATTTNTPATVVSTATTLGRPSATAKPMYTAAISAITSPCTVAAGSHHTASGTAALTKPQSPSHATGSRRSGYLREGAERTPSVPVRIDVMGPTHTRRLLDTERGFGGRRETSWTPTGCPLFLRAETARSRTVEGGATALSHTFQNCRLPDSGADLVRAAPRGQRTRIRANDPDRVPPPRHRRP